MINFRKILALVFPTRCQYCKEVIPFDTLICKECLEKVKPKKHLTNLVMEDGKELIVNSSFIYEKEIKRAICDFKFRGKIEFSEHLGKCMAQIVRENYNLQDFDFITSVPLLSKRKKTKTYNHAEVLARKISKILALPYVEALSKIKENKKQHMLSKEERKQNVIGVYIVSDCKKVLSKKILLCDDIVTTGSTLNECAKMLYNGGAEKIVCITAAKTEFCK